MSLSGDFVTPPLEAGAELPKMSRERAPKVRKRGGSIFERVSPHRMVRVRRATGKPLEQFNATKSPPWVTKPKNRAKAKAARTARKGNR